ncbi:hypothetical protein SESBI_04614 [Sesbania bispinosa]|nr:hypothetical protein SESBI_04614 [Sesbania bispinosa]
MCSSKMTPAPVQDVPQEVVYEGGPQDTSLLRSYESHVARHLWTNEVVTHKRKPKRLENYYIKDIVDDCGLGPLIKGEMTITLDDVSNLLHIPIAGRFFFLPPMSKNDANQLLVTALGVSYSKAFVEIEIIRGPYVRLSWLRNIYKKKKIGVC